MFRIIITATLATVGVLYLGAQCFLACRDAGYEQTGVAIGLGVWIVGAVMVLINGAMSVVEWLDRLEAMEAKKKKTARTV